MIADASGHRAIRHHHRRPVSTANIRKAASPPETRQPSGVIAITATEQVSRVNAGCAGSSGAWHGTKRIRW